MAKTINQLLNMSNAVRNETQNKANTATRVGELFVEIVNWLDTKKSLSGMSDVNISNLQTGNVLKFDGYKWVPGDADTDGLAAGMSYDPSNMILTLQDKKGDQVGQSVDISSLASDATGKPRFITDELMQYYRNRTCKIGGLVKDRPDSPDTEGGVPASTPLTEAKLSDFKSLGIDYIITSVPGFSAGSYSTVSAAHHATFMTTLRNADRQGVKVWAHNYVLHNDFDGHDLSGLNESYLEEALEHPSFEGLWIDEPPACPGGGVFRSSSSSAWKETTSQTIKTRDVIVQYYNKIKSHNYNGKKAKVDVNLYHSGGLPMWKDNKDSNVEYNEYYNGAFNYNGYYEQYVNNYALGSDTISLDIYRVRYAIHYVSSTQYNIVDGLYRLEEGLGLVEWPLSFNYLLNAYHASQNVPYDEAVKKDMKCFISTTQLIRGDLNDFSGYSSLPPLTTQSLALQCYCALICGVSDMTYFCLCDSGLKYSDEYLRYQASPYYSYKTGFAKNETTWNIIKQFNTNSKFKVLKNFITTKYIYGVDIYKYKAAYGGQPEYGKFVCASLTDQPNLKKIDTLIPNFISTYTRTSKFMVSIGYDDNASYCFIVNLNFVDTDNPETNYAGYEYESELVIRTNAVFDVKQITVNDGNTGIVESPADRTIKIDPCDICILKIPYTEFSNKNGVDTTIFGTSLTYDLSKNQLQLLSNRGENIGDAVELEYEALKGYNSEEGFDNDPNTGAYRRRHAAFTLERKHKNPTNGADPMDSHAYGQFSVSIGKGTIASGTSAHAEGWGNRAVGNFSHVQNEGGRAVGESSHAGGIKSEASGRASFVHGLWVGARGRCAFSEGQGSTSIGSFSHVENLNNTASADSSHAGGNYTVTNGNSSFAHGNFLKTNSSCEAAFGYMNNSLSGSSTSSTTIFSVGIGERYTTDTGNGATEESISYIYSGTSTELLYKPIQSWFKRKNALEIRRNGDIYIWLNGNQVKLQDYLSQITIPSNARPSFGADSGISPTQGINADEIVVNEPFEPVYDPDLEYQELIQLENPDITPTRP